MGLLETLRKWVDGDDGDDALSKAAAEQAKPRRQAEEFIAQIAKGIGEVMSREAVPLPPDQTVIPPEYIVFLSDEDDREWQGVKRRALETGLQHVLAEHAKDLAGKTKLATASFSIELRVDGTLPKNEIRVQHSWEESASQNKTSITARPPRLTKTDALPAPNNAVGKEPVATSPASQMQHTSQLAPTMYGANPNEFATANTATTPSESGDDATRVTARSDKEAVDEATRVAKRQLYSLEVWRNNQQISVIPIAESEISIGRKSNKIPSDVQLSDDAEISRPHAILQRDAIGNFIVVHKGKNPTLVNGREVPPDDVMPVRPGEDIVIGSYTLRIAV